MAGEYRKFVRGHRLGINGNVIPKDAPEYIEQDCGFDTPCWVWQKAKSQGYGKIGVNGIVTSSHILFYERAHGPVPEGMELDHLCRNRSCVNPDHLEPVTDAINTQRGSAAKLTPEQVVEIRSLRGRVKQKDLAERYGVTPHQIYMIVTRRAWKNI